MKAKDAASLQEKKQKSLERWKFCLGFAEKGYKHPYKKSILWSSQVSHLVCWRPVLQQLFEKHLSRKVDSVVVARDSEGKSRGCAFVTMRWKKFHDRNPGYNRHQETAAQEKLWADFLVNITNQEIFVVATSTSSLLAARGAAKALCVAGPRGLPGQRQRRGWSELWTLGGCVKSITLRYRVAHLRVAQVTQVAGHTNGAPGAKATAGPG